MHGTLALDVAMENASPTPPRRQAEVQATAVEAEEELDEFEPIEKLDQLGVNRGSHLRVYRRVVYTLSAHDTAFHRCSQQQQRMCGAHRVICPSVVASVPVLHAADPVLCCQRCWRQCP